MLPKLNARLLLIQRPSLKTLWTNSNYTDFGNPMQDTSPLAKQIKKHSVTHITAQKSREYCVSLNY